MSAHGGLSQDHQLSVPAVNGSQPTAWTAAPQKVSVAKVISWNWLLSCWHERAEPEVPRREQSRTLPRDWARQVQSSAGDLLATLSQVPAQNQDLGQARHRCSPQSTRLRNRVGSKATSTERFGLRCPSPAPTHSSQAEENLHADPTRSRRARHSGSSSWK